MKLLKLVLVILMFSVFVSLASAQEEDVEPKGTEIDNPVAAVYSKAAEVLSTKNGSIDILEAFKGWQQIFHGYSKSPILIDPSDVKYIYPELASNEGGTVEGVDRTRPSLMQANLGVYDEVAKTSMSIYQSQLDLEKDFSEDEFANQKYYEMIETLRATTNLTLMFLDKTVAAGLAVTKNQSQMHVNNALLQQISWSSAKLANPRREQIYNDTDEKVEQCLLGISNMSIGRVRFAGTSGNYACQESCGPVPTGEQSKRYGWCVCCASRDTHQNATLQSGGKSFASSLNTPADAQDRDHFSLIDRAFFGTNLPGASGGKLDCSANSAAAAPGEADDGTGPNAITQRVVQTACAFKEMYGDVVLTTKAEEDGVFRYEYVFPRFSVKEKVDFFRDGCSRCVKCDNNSGGKIACPITGVTINHGICPALEAIITNAPQLGKSSEEIDPSSLGGIFAQGSGSFEKRLFEIWIEASMGIVLDARNIGDFVKQGTRNDEKVTITPRLRRILDSFCDASAVAAFKSFHARFKTIVLDHLTLNQKATVREKARVMELIDRVTNYLAAAEMDVKGSWVARTMLAQLSKGRDMDDTTTAHAGSIKARGRYALNSRAGTGWGGGQTKFCSGANCPGGTGETPTIPDPGPGGGGLDLDGVARRTPSFGEDFFRNIQR